MVRLVGKGEIIRRIHPRTGGILRPTFLMLHLRSNTKTAR